MEHSNSRRRFFRSAGKFTAAAPAIYAMSAAYGSAATTEEISGPACQRSGKILGLTRSFECDLLELIRLLKEVTEVEHSLMLQYIYAAFSLKPGYAALVGSGAPDSHSFLGVAVQEMQHLGSINKLLVQLGAAPNMGVQDFPYEYEIYPFDMTLEPLSRNSVAKYAYCEAPPLHDLAKTPSPETSAFLQQLEATLGDDLKINHVGSVYALIIDLFDSVVRSGGTYIDRDYWIEELKRIMDEGEHDHFNFFKSVFMGTNPVFKAKPDWWSAATTSDAFPSYNNVTNPSAYDGQPNAIRDPRLRRVAWLGNLYYWSILVLLDHYYRSGEDELRNIALVSMMSPLKSIGQWLAANGQGMPFDRLSLGTSPCSSGPNNLDFCCRLMSEITVLSESLKGKLPPDYPIGIEKSIDAQIKARIVAQRKTDPSKGVYTLMSTVARS